MKLTLFRLFCVAVMISGFAGCSTTPKPSGTPHVPPDATAFTAPTDVTATLTNGNNVIVHWRKTTTLDGGVWIEYTTPGYEYIKLQAFPSDDNETTFTHANIAPETTFLYHLQPFFGKPTKPVEITTGIAPTNGDSKFVTGPINPTNTVTADQDKKFSIRTMATFAAAMPSDLSATLSSPTSVDVRWKDHASDEDGYLLEISARPDEAFVPCALMPPNMTSFRKAGLPGQTKVYFRLRAFFDGKPTDPVSVRTGP